MLKSREIFVFILVALSVRGCPDDPLCSTCTNGTICGNCFNSWPDLEGICRPTRDFQVENCQSYINPDGRGFIVTCSTCALGYSLRPGNRQCNKCSVKHCAVCDSNVEKCTACFGNRHLKNGVCEEESSGFPNCELAAEDSCVLCKIGFIELRNTCVATAKNCLKLTPDQKKCEICRVGTFITREGTCSGVPLPIFDPDQDTPKGKDKLIYAIVFLMAFILAIAAFVFLRKRDEQNSRTNEYRAVQ